MNSSHASKILHNPTNPHDSSRRVVAAVFAGTLFVSATLMFLLQPLFARLVLPKLGGTPAVWNTCLVFFQVVLLAGYSYAHLLPNWLGVRRQAVLHLGLLALPFLCLPIRLGENWRPPAGGREIFGLLEILTWRVGLPFFVVSTTAPLLQRWFAESRLGSRTNPYALYAASNLGSMLALLAYPFLFEPMTTLAQQSRLWNWGYGLFVVLVAVCAGVVWFAPAPAAATNLVKSPIPWRRRGRWLLLAFAPASLLMSVTTYLTTDIAAIPLLWLLPLAIFLFSFILVFAEKPIFSQVFLDRWMPVVVITQVLTMVAKAREPLWLVLTLHLLGFFFVCMVCHGELVRLKPPSGQLTEFYLLMSLGGALGGIFNALLAPVLFSTVLEYPLVLVLACLLRQGTVPIDSKSALPWLTRQDLLYAGLLCLLTVGLVLGVQRLEITSNELNTALMFGVPAVLCYTFLDRASRFGLGVAALFLASAFYFGIHGQIEYRARSFFGVNQVTQKIIRDAEGNESNRFRLLIHGTTLHGQQSLTAKQKATPLSYYYPTGPIGGLLTSCNGRANPPKHIAVVGLGAGALAAYARENQHWTFYEIDPVVVHIACETEWFSYWRDCRAASKKVVLGDARLKLEAADPEQYDLLILDAFSSDAIPTHLLTQEAFDLYFSKLSPEGVLAIHISNQFMDLVPVVTDLAGFRGWKAYVQHDLAPTEAEKNEGKEASQWAVVVRKPSDMPRKNDPNWQALPPRAQPRVWTDDFFNLLHLLRRNQANAMPRAK